MNEAIQSAMHIKQAQMDRDRSKFLKTNRAMQNTLFHGLYGGKSIADSANDSLAGDKEDQISTASVQLHMLQTSLSMLVIQQKESEKSEVNDNDETPISQEEDALVEGGPASDDPSHPSFPLGCNSQAIRSAGHPMQGRLEILQNLHSLERQLRVVKGIHDERDHSNKVKDSHDLGYLRLLFVRTMIANAVTLVKDGGSKNDISLAIDLLESGYGIYGYLTPAVDPRDAERAELLKNNDKSKPQDKKPGNGGMEAIKDDAVNFHSLRDGVSVLWSSCHSGNKSATAPNPSHSKNNSNVAAIVTCILTTIGSLISKEAHKPEIARAMFHLPLAGQEDPSTDSSSTFSDHSKSTLTSIAQFGALSDAMCNLALCYAKESNLRNVVKNAQSRDEDSEAILEELLSMPTVSSLTEGQSLPKDDIILAIVNEAVSMLVGKTSPSVAKRTVYSSISDKESNHSLRATYLLAKSIGCSVSSTTLDSEKAVAMLSEVIDVWDKTFKGEPNLSDLIIASLQNELRNDKPTLSVAPLLTDFVKLAFNICKTQLGDCKSLRDSILNEIRSSQANLQKKLTADAIARKNNNTEKNRSDKKPETIDTFEIENDMISSPEEVEGRQPLSPAKVPPQPLTTSVASKRHEILEFKMREEIIRLKKALVSSIYKNLFLPADDSSISTAPAETEKPTSSKQQSVADFASKLEAFESQQRILRYQPLAQQPEAQRSEYLKHITAIHKTRTELLDTLCRRLFSQVMSPARCFRLEPFIIDSMHPSAPPTTKEEYTRWATSLASELQQEISSPSSTSNKLPIFRAVTPNLILVLQSATSLGIPLCGPLDKRERDFQGNVNSKQALPPISDDGLEADELEQVFRDAVASISQPNLMLKQHQNDFMWHSWEVRKALRKLVLGSLYPQHAETHSLGSNEFNYRFSLMAPGPQQTLKEMEISKHYFTLNFLENFGMKTLAIAAKSYFVETAHKVLGMFLESEEHNERVNAALIDAKQRKEALMNKSN